MKSGWPGQSWYEAEAPAPVLPRLTDRVRCRVAIIGAGLAGMSTAVGLIERGVSDVAVIDAGQPGNGASGRNGGFVFAGYSLDNQTLIRQVGVDEARCLHAWTRDSRDLIRQRIERHNIACQVVDEPVVLADWFSDDEALANYQRRMAEQLDFRLDWLDPEALASHVNSPRYGAGLAEPGSFHFHPLRHIRGLADVVRASGGQVLGDSAVTGLSRTGTGWCLKSDAGEVLADEVVLATGGYDRQLCRPVQRALQPVATYIAVTEPLGKRIRDLLPRPVAVYDTRFAFDYYRPLPDTRLLWGGRISMASRSPAAIRKLLARDLGRVFPDLGPVQFEHAWGGWMSYARHQMPLLGQRDDGLWHALAFGGHGMATTCLAGEIMAEALNGESGRLQAFSRWRPDWAGGILGRAWIQGVYWGLQARDWWRGRHRRFF